MQTDLNLDTLHLDTLRRDARRLLRAVRAGDADAHARARAVLRARVDERFVLADALHVLAREHGAASWPALLARRRRGPIRRGLDEALAGGGAAAAELDVETDVVYPGGEPVVITVKRREGRYLLTDEGRAVARAGRRRGWLEAAERAVRRSGMNVARTGAVFVPAVERRDLESLAARLAQASIDALEAVLELEE